MATITSTQSGLASAGSTWVGGVAPVTGDLVVIANGHTVNWNTGLTGAGAGVLLGSNAGAAGHAFTVNGASNVSFGTLIVDDGATLYLRGFDVTNNTLGLVNRFGQLNPAPGSMIVGDVAGDYGAIISNKGQISALGTTPKPVLFTSPAANYSWTNAAAEAFPNGGASSWLYDPIANVACGSLSKKWIANAANTGLGSFGDTSLTFAAQSPASILATEVASLAAVNGAGKYFVDYDEGFVYFFHVTSAGNPSATATYKYLTNAKGWGIVSSQSTTFNSAVFDHCVFEYMGKQTAADSRVLDVQNKLSAGANGAATDRLFQLTNCTARFCQLFLGLKACNGTQADPLLITGNTFGACGGSSSFGFTLDCFRSASTYIKIDGNTDRSRDAFLLVQVSGAQLVMTGWTFTNNVHTGGDFLNGVHLAAVWPDTVISGNTFNCVGWALDYRVLVGCGGTNGHPLVFQDNFVNFSKRAVHFCSDFQAIRNVVRSSYHHVFVGDTSDDCQVSRVKIQNNLVFGQGSQVSPISYGSPAIEIGYNHRHWIDDFVASNNTIVDDSAGFIGWGDAQDTTGIVTTLTNVEVTNNLAVMQSSTGSTAIKRQAATATLVTRLAGVVEFDNNLDHNYATRYGTGAPKQGTFTLGGAVYNRLTGGSRNVTGVSLCAPSYAAAQTGKSLVLTVTAADSNVTLAWGGGAAQQLIFGTNGTGTATSAANNSSSGIAGLYSGSFTVSGAAWSTSFNNAACPAGRWLKTLTGTGAGQIRQITNNTATVLTVAPAWTVVPDATTTYAIYNSEVTLTEVNGTDTVIAGVDLRTLPTTSQTDTGIALSVSANLTGSSPLLANVAGTTAVDFKLTASSPAKDAGQSVNAPAADYFGTARPQGASFDIGFHELAAASGLLAKRRRFLE